MSSVFDFDRSADCYAVMGNPVSHSKSPQIHRLFAQQTRQAIEYSAIQVDPGGFSQAVGNFVASQGKGLNVTVPFKAEAFKLADTLSEGAQAAGAVNTILVQDSGLRGENTDGIGLVRDIVENHGGGLQGRQILLLGAGGAARGIIAPLLEHKPRCLFITNRSAEKAQMLAQLFHAEGEEVIGGGFDQLEKRSFDLVINATSASLSDSELPLSSNLLNPNAWCYDLMYGQKTNPFLRWAREAGAEVILDGLGMLVEQAAESFYLWRGVRPDTRPVLEVLNA